MELLEIFAQSSTMGLNLILFMYRWKDRHMNTLELCYYIMSINSTSFFTWLHDIKKHLTCHLSRRLSSLLEPPDKHIGISYTTLFGWSKVTNASRLLIVQNPSPSVSVLPLQVYTLYTPQTYWWLNKFTCAVTGHVGDMTAIWVGGCQQTEH